MFVYECLSELHANVAILAESTFLYSRIIHMVITDIVEYSWLYITIFLFIDSDRCFNAPMRTEGEAHEDNTELKMDRELTHHCKWSF